MGEIVGNFLVLIENANHPKFVPNSMMCVDAVRCVTSVSMCVDLFRCVSMCVGCCAMVSLVFARVFLLV